MENENTDTLYDQVYEWSQSKAKHANIGIDTKGVREVETQMRVYGRRLKEARRFYLDDDFVATALEMSRDLDRLQYWINLARLPYENIWIEFDARQKVLSSWVQGHLHNNVAPSTPPDLTDVSPAIGWLLHQTNEDTGAWVASQFSPVANNKGVLHEGEITTTPVAWICSPEGDATLPLRAPDKLTLLHKLLPLYTEHVANMGIGATTSNAYDGKSCVILPWVANRLGVAVEPIWNMAFNSILIGTKMHVQEKHLKEDLARHITYILREDIGIMRFMIAVLALLNAAPNVKHVPVKQQGFRRKGLKRLEYLGHSKIILELPKRKTIKVLYGALDYASHERRRLRGHMVRGHFRQVEHGKARIVCDHIPTLVENGLGICLQCERLIRWIPSHPRGDATLGWVTHDYEIKASDNV